jgi:hypothetical protein
MSYKSIIIIIYYLLFHKKFFSFINEQNEGVRNQKYKKKISSSIAKDHPNIVTTMSQTLQFTFSFLFRAIINYKILHTVAYIQIWSGGGGLKKITNIKTFRLKLPIFLTIKHITRININRQNSKTNTKVYITHGS